VELHPSRGPQLLIQCLLVQYMLESIAPPARLIRAGHQPQTYSENKELRGSDRLEGHAIPQPLHPPCELVDEMFAPTFVKVMGPQLPIGFLAREPMEGTDHDRMGHGDDGTLLPPTGGQALIQGRQLGPLGVGCRMGQLGQAYAQSLVA